MLASCGATKWLVVVVLMVVVVHLEGHFENVIVSYKLHYHNLIPQILGIPPRLLSKNARRYTVSDMS